MFLSQGSMYERKKCSECAHVPNSEIKNTCIDHPKSALSEVELCIRPEDSKDHRWIGGLLRKHILDQQCNFHCYSSVLSHRIPTKIRKDITSAVKSNPLKTN